MSPLWAAIDSTKGVSACGRLDGGNRDWAGNEIGSWSQQRGDRFGEPTAGEGGGLATVAEFGAGQ